MEPWRRTRAARWRASLIPRPSVPRSSLLRPSFLVPPSLRPRWLPLLRAAQNDRRGQRSKRGRGAQWRSLHAGRAEPRGCAACAAATAGRDRDRGRAPPATSSRPSRPPPRARLTQQSRLDMVASAAPLAARGRAASRLLPKTQWAGGEHESPASPQLSPPLPHLHRMCPRHPSTVLLQQGRSREEASARLPVRLPPGAPRREPPLPLETTLESLAFEV